MAEFVSHLSPRLFQFFSGPPLTRADAEDLVQDCWLRIHHSRHTYLPSEPLLPWIFAIARHTRLDDYRRRQRRGRRELLVATVPEPPQQPSGPAAGRDVM